MASLTTSVHEWQGKRIVLHSLVGASELNGRKGIVQGPSGPERFQVMLAAEGMDKPARAASVKPMNMTMAPEYQQGAGEDINGAPAALEGDGSRNDANKVERRPRPTAFMSARPGEYRPGYDWRAVLPGQQLPRGLEIIASLSGTEDTEPTLARIPPKWKLAVGIQGEGNGGAYRSVASVRIEVERMTTIGDVKAAVRRAEPALFGEGQSPSDIIINGTPYAGSDTDTVERARAFGSDVSIRTSPGVLPTP